MNLKPILKEKGVHCREVVRSPNGFICRGLRFTGDPSSQTRLVALAVAGYGYHLKIKETDRNGKTHYQFHIQRQS